MKNEDTRPFWLQEYEYLRKREQLEKECWHAGTLHDALLCGANMTILIDENGDRHQVGYLDENRRFEIYDEDYDEKLLKDTLVEFYSLDRDDDGYTIAIFEKVAQ